MKNQLLKTRREATPYKRLVTKVYHMPTVSVTLTKKQKKELLVYGGLSKGLKEGVGLYLKAQRSQDLFRKLEELQKRYPVKTASGKELIATFSDR